MTVGFRSGRWYLESLPDFSKAELPEKAQMDDRAKHGRKFPYLPLQDYVQIILLYDLLRQGLWVLDGFCQL